MIYLEDVHNLLLRQILEIKYLVSFLNFYCTSETQHQTKIQTKYDEGAL